MLSLTSAYEELEQGDLVELRFADGARESVTVDGMVWLSGHHRPLQIISRGRRYALGGDDQVVRGLPGRGY